MMFTRTIIERRLTLRQQEVLDFLLNEGDMVCQMKYGSGVTNSLRKIISQLRHTHGLIIVTIRYEESDYKGRPSPGWTYRLDADSKERARLLLKLSEFGG